MPVNEELAQYIRRNMQLYDKCGYYYNQDYHFYAPRDYAEEEQRIRDLEVYDDDVWVLTYPKCDMMAIGLKLLQKYHVADLFKKRSHFLTYPKCGTTWSQEMVWLLCNNLDYNSAETLIDIRFPFLEITPMIKGDDRMKPGLIGTPKEDIVKTVQQMPRPRFIKSHLPVGLLPKQLFQKKPKIVFVLREPKDTAVSYLNHYQVFAGYHGTADKFYEAFIDGCVLFGSYWHHTAPFWKLRHDHPNMLVLTFEEMKKDLASVVCKTAKFLEKPLKEEDKTRLMDHLSFSKIKTNNAINFSEIIEETNTIIGRKDEGETVFMRKGEVGDYKNTMSPEMAMKYKHHAEMKRKLGLSDDKDFPY